MRKHEDPGHARESRRGARRATRASALRRAAGLGWTLGLALCAVGAAHAQAADPPTGTPPIEQKGAAGGSSGGLSVPNLQESGDRPFNGFATRDFLRSGPVGFMDFSLGLSAGNGSVLNNFAVNSGMRFSPSLRGHLTAAFRAGNPHLSADHIIQEGYLDFGGTRRVLGGPMLAGVRVGKTQNLAFTPTPLSIFDPGPLWLGGRKAEVPGYGQLVPYVDWEHDDGIGFSLAADADFLNGGGPTGGALQGYMRLRAIEDNGYVMEMRSGWLAPRMLDHLGHTSRSPQLGTSLYMGKQWRGGSSVGLAVEQTLNDPFRIGARLSMPTGGTGRALGSSLARLGTSGGPGLQAQLPLARVNLGQHADTPPRGGQLVGMVRARRIYRADSRRGAAQFPINDEYEISREGQTTGAGLVRVVTEWPRQLSGVGGLYADGNARSGLNTEYTQDVVYGYYRVVPFSDTWLQGRVYDQDNPQRAIDNLVVRLRSTDGEEELAPQGGSFKLKRQLPGGKRQTVTVVAQAPGYAERAFEAELAPKATRTLEIPLRQLRAEITGLLLDADTGLPIGEAEALITPDGGQRTVVLTGPNGEFRMPEAAPGKYQFSTHAPRYYPVSQELVLAPGQAGRLELRLRPRPAALAGKLLDANGQPVVGARLSLVGPDGARHEIETLKDGSYGVNGLKPGSYTVTRTLGGQRYDQQIELAAGDIVAARFPMK